MKNDAKETAAMSVSADGRPCVPPDTNVNEYERRFMCSSTPLRSYANQFETSIAPAPVKSKKKIKGFFLPNHIFDYGLTPGAFCVYCYLCRCRNAKDGNTCFPSYKTIAAACGISKRSVSNALRQLEAEALIYRRNRFAGRRQTSNLYYLPDAQPLPGECVTIACSPVLDLPGGKVSGACQEQYELNNTNKEHPSFNKELAGILEYAELDSVTDLYMRETLGSLITQMFFSESISVDGAVIPNEQIRKQLNRLTCDTVHFALDKFRDYGGNICRGSKYFMACLYNAVNDFDIQTDLKIPRL